MIGGLNKRDKSVTIVGAGVSGLLMAAVLDQAGYEVTLIEKSKTPGGLIQTTRTEFGIAESAAHSVLATPLVKNFFSEVGCELVAVQKTGRSKFILRDGRFRRFPLSPTEAFGFFLRLAFTKQAKSPKLKDDASLREWAELFLGKAATRYLIHPMVTGIYGATPDELAVRAAFPRAWEKGIRGLFSGPKGEMSAPRYGMTSFIDAMTVRLRDRLQSRFRLGEEVTRLPDVANLVLTTPTDVTARLIRSVDPASADALERVRYSSLVSATVFVSKAHLRTVPQGTGVLFPPVENRKVLGILYNSSAFPERVTDPGGTASFTVILGGSSEPGLIQAPDSEILDRIQDEFADLYGLSDRPLLTRIHRWPRAIPQYGPDLLRAWAALEKGFCSRPGRVFFGNASGEVSLRGMIETASRLG
jgi:oxygen-dependent protoporphyrinogen oxidase